MQSVNIRELMHNFSHYLKEVKAGGRITILEHRKAVAEIVPHNENIQYPGWKRIIQQRKIGGESFSKTIQKGRDSK